MKKSIFIKTKTYRTGPLKKIDQVNLHQNYLIACLLKHRAVCL